MAKRIVKEVNIPIYGSTVVIGFHADAMNKYLHKNYDIEHEIPYSNLGQSAHFVFNESECSLFTIYIDGENYNHSTVAHEAVHCAWHILDDVGVELTANNHEPLTYLVGYLVNETNEFYRNYK